MTVSNPETLKKFGQARIFEDGKKRNHKQKQPAGTGVLVAALQQHIPNPMQFISHCSS